MKNEKIKIILFLLVLVSACREENVLSRIDLYNWEKATLNFIQMECNVSLDTMTLGTEPIIVIHNDITYKSAGDYLKSLLAPRDTLISWIRKERLELNWQTKLWENYSGDFVRFYIIVDNHHAYAIQMPTKPNQNFEHKKISANQVMDMFEEKLNEDETNCFSNYTVVPSKFHIYSKFNKKSGKLEPYRVALFN